MQPYHRTDPQKEAYFQQDDKKGGPTDPLLWFHDHYETILKDEYPSIEDYPLYTYLKQFSPSKPGSSKGKLHLPLYRSVSIGAFIGKGRLKLRCRFALDPATWRHVCFTKQQESLQDSEVD